MGNYRNFDLVVYFIADGVVNATREKLQQDIDFFKKHMRLDKVYLKPFSFSSVFDTSCRFLNSSCHMHNKTPLFISEQERFCVAIQLLQTSKSMCYMLYNSNSASNASPITSNGPGVTLPAGRFLPKKSVSNTMFVPSGFSYACSA